LAFACPFRLRPELQPPRAGENCEQVLTHQNCSPFFRSSLVQA
jgi:hypothetical protein